jgi:hypothetical protein
MQAPVGELFWRREQQTLSGLAAPTFFPRKRTTS